MEDAMPITKNLAKNDREWKTLLRSKDKNVVRTASEWKKLIASRGSPLAGVDQKLVTKFTKSLKFKNGGLAHADYSMLVNEVSFSKFRKIWEHFGMDLTLFADHDGYRCVGNGSCQALSNYICTSNC
jgi:hypothetical protein